MPPTPAPNKLSAADISNAFQPNREASVASRFAGRKEQLNTAQYALLSDGTNIAIVGNRGIGKTSLAKQVMRIAEGDCDDSSTLDLPGDAASLNFATLYFACRNTIANCQELLGALLSNREGLGQYVYEIPQGSLQSTSVEGKGGVNVPILNAKLGKRRETTSSTAFALATHSAEAIFTNVLAAASKDAPLLLVIDEFDQIGDRTGIGSLLKSLATNVPTCKFVLVGVAQDIEQLIQDHDSVNRLFAGGIINLPPMSCDELTEIVAIAEKHINQQITFERDARQQLVSLAAGHPYLVHLIGKHALLLAFTRNAKRVGKRLIDEALQMIATKGLEPALDGRYKRAVRASVQREVVLKAMAEAQSESYDGEILTKKAYTIAEKRGVDNASQFVGQLVTKEYGEEIVKVGGRRYRFKDSLFATYVRVRPTNA